MNLCIHLKQKSNGSTPLTVSPERSRRAKSRSANLSQQRKDFPQPAPAQGSENAIGVLGFTTAIALIALYKVNVQTSKRICLHPLIHEWTMEMSPIKIGIFTV